MIWESRYWKADLLKIAERMRHRADQKRWTERSWVNLEKDMFLAFYMIRKLIEAQKLSTSVSEMNLDIMSYTAIGSGMTLMNWHRIGEHFNLEHPHTGTRDLMFICNRFIHSYAFIPFMNDNDYLSGFYVCSDRDRNRQLFGVEITEIIKCLEAVGNDDVVSATYELDKKSGDWVSVRYATHEHDNVANLNSDT